MVGAAHLDSAWAKWERGNVHTETFGGLEVDFAARVGSPAEASTGPDGWTIYRRRELPDPPLDLSMVFGDALQAFRSALEHAVFALSQAADPKCVRTEYPITLRASDFRSRRRGIQHLSKARQKFVERTQPYAAGKRARFTILWQLHDLARLDRHRSIPLFTAAVLARSVATTTQLGDNPQTVEVSWSGVVTTPGTELLRVGPRPTPDTLTTPEWRVFVVVQRHGPWARLLLENVSKGVEAIMRELETEAPPLATAREHVGSMS